MKKSYLIAASIFFMGILLLVCILAVMLFQSVFFDNPDCYGDAIDNLPPLYPNSNLLTQEEDADPILGSYSRQYSTDDSPENVAEFYSEQSTCFFYNPNYFAVCIVSVDTTNYTILIETEGENTYYQIIAEWNCKGLD